MCARRFLIFVFILILLFVAGAFAIFQFGQQVLIKQATPKGHFQAPAPRSGPDYTQMESWLARPGLNQHDDPADWKPAGAPTPQSFAEPAAVFYIHPTTYLERDRWNAPLSGHRQSDYRDLLFVQSQASAFNDTGAIWAPRYRQAAYGAFLLRNEDAQKALDLAYSDVAAAFDEFLKRNPDEPIILAGHSQGALHLSRLLRERSTQLKGRLVAAYVVGWPLSTPADLPTHVLIPAYALSEVKTAFQMGFVLFLPFLVIDMVVASVLMSMGMLMLPPVMISLPFKLLLFVLADGWNLVIRALVSGYR